MNKKRRLSASVDADLLRLAQAAVDERRVGTIGAWVNDALRLNAEHDRRMQAILSFPPTRLRTGMSDDEMAEAARRARSRATVVRSVPAKQPKVERGPA